MIVGFGKVRGSSNMDAGVGGSYGPLQMPAARASARPNRGRRADVKQRRDHDDQRRR